MTTWSGTPTVGRYTVLGRIARGPTSDVLLAVPSEQPGAPRVVLKRLYPYLVDHDDSVRMFVDEVRLMALLRHRGTVGVVDLDEDGETFFSALELVDGPSVSAALRLRASSSSEARSAGVCPVDVAVVIAARVAEALHVVHGLVEPDGGGPLLVVHRDVAPANVLVGVDAQGRGVVKIADFGLARSVAGRKSGLLSSRDTQAGSRKGRVSTLSPEQVTGRSLDHRTDLWALGVTLWTMLVGAPPFSAPVEVDLLDAILHAPLPRLAGARRAAGLPDDERAGAVQEVLDALLARDRDARPTSAAAVAAQLRAIVPAADEDAIVAAFVRSLGLPSLRV